MVHFGDREKGYLVRGLKQIFLNRQRLGKAFNKEKKGA